MSSRRPSPSRGPIRRGSRTFCCKSNGTTISGFQRRRSAFEASIVDRTGAVKKWHVARRRAARYRWPGVESNVRRPETPRDAPRRRLMDAPRQFATTAAGLLPIDRRHPSSGVPLKSATSACRMCREKLKNKKIQKKITPSAADRCGESGRFRIHRESAPVEPLNAPHFALRRADDGLFKR